MNIIIAGGGMAGATLALALSHCSCGALPVTLIEASAPDLQRHPGFDSRAIALAAGTCQQLCALNIWPHLAPVATAITQVQVSDRGHCGFVTLNASDYALAALGQVVELHEVGQRLFQLLRQAPGVKLCCPDSVQHIERDASQVTVTLASGEALQGALLVAADGSHSQVAAACQLQVEHCAYGQVAVTANVTTAEAHHGRAYERFTTRGPLALLPMSGGRSSLVWCHPADHQERVDSWSDVIFLQQLQQAFGWRLGRFTQVGQRTSYPLVLQRMKQRVSHRVALVGNAAQTLHPIAGQGFNLGLRDVMSLAETVIAAWRSGEDPGGYAVLQRYQQRRQSDVGATVGLTDGLVRLFASHDFPLVAGRNLGLAVMDNLPFLRQPLARRTLGWVAR